MDFMKYTSNERNKFLQDKQREEREKQQRLAKLTEQESFSLSAEDKYDRIRYLRELEGYEKVRAWRRSVVQEDKPKKIVSLNRRDWD